MTTATISAANADWKSKPEVIPGPSNTWAGVRVPRPAYKLDPILKARWISALLSGNILQARSTLRKKINGKFGYCCLGVLCNTISHRKGWFEDNDADDDEYGWRHFGARDVKELAEAPGFPDSAVLSFLATVNDEGGSFAQIAEWVGKYL